MSAASAGTAAPPVEVPLRELVERSRLLGADPSLVVHGGGNTSAKGEVVDHLGRRQRVLWVKGSGADLASAGEQDYPALRLDELLPLRDRDGMADEEMVDLVTRALLDPSSRRPSIETLLHAFLPYVHVDHVHADAVCALTNHAGGPQAVAEALGDGFAYVDWMRPGFTLSTVVGDLEHYQGVVLAHHGLVTWAEDSDTCLRRTLDAVTAATTYLDGRVERTPARHEDLPDDELQKLLLHLRGRLSRTGRRVLRVEPRLREVADRADVADVVAAGVSSGDHMLRIGPWSAAVADPHDPAEAAAVVDEHAARYTDYVERNRELLPAGTQPHDPAPRVLLVPGLGGVTTGRSLAEAQVLGDIASRTHAVAATVIDAFGPPEPLSETETFRFDYWPMELFKLQRRPAPLPMAGSVVVVTGAASGIGRGIARHLAGLGASLVLADLDGDALHTVADQVEDGPAGRPATVVGDQSDPGVVTDTVASAVRTFGGLDGVVLNAGIGVTGKLVDLEVADWDRAQRVNTTSAFLLTREAMRALREQGCGGSLVYVASKNALGPGAGFGAYSASKAAMVQLMRVAALEGGAHGIRANAVTPDAVFDGSGLWGGGLREERAAAHGIAPEELEDFYAARNLLHRRVTTADVAHAVQFLLQDVSSRTTGALLPVDGGVAAAFPR